MREYARHEGPGWERNIFPRSDAASPILWLLVGMGIGAGLALLLAPSSGRELRGVLARGYRRTIDGVSRGTQQLRQHGSNLISFTRRSGISGT
jgi:gas vesicle protein